MTTRNNTINKIQGITPIPTEFNGTVFKSRLEARWARFFDLVNIEYEYETEGFQEGDKMYLPDFYLPNVWLRDYGKGAYLEIKPEGFSDRSHEYKWSVMAGKNFLVCIGNPPPGYNDSETSLQIYPTWDNDMTLMKCVYCGFTKFEFCEQNYRTCRNNQNHFMFDIRHWWRDHNMPNDNRIFNTSKVWDIWKEMWRR